MINDNIKRYYVLGGFENTKEGLKRNYEGRNHKKEFNKWLWILTVLSYYVLGGLKTQKILTRKRNWICEYVERNIKRNSINDCDKW